MNKKQKRSARCLCIQLLYSLELSDNYSSQDIIDHFFKTKDHFILEYTAVHPLFFSIRRIIKTKGRLK